MEQTRLGLTTTLHTDFQTAEKRVVEALKAEGFGVLTEIDVRATMKQKLDVDFRPYKILGACNPPLAHRALTTAPEVGLLLPCNVTLSENAPGEILVSLVDPMMMVDVIAHESLKPVAEEARQRLEKVVQALEME
jgi:uncharacterized protein (DUF302 family)